MTEEIKKFGKDKDVANRYSISRASVWRWVRQGLLPRPVKIAGSTRFDLEACDRAFNEGGDYAE